MTRLTSQELEKLLSEENWKALWAAAVPWVKFAASSLRTDDKEDLIQDGLLKVGTQIKNWNPALGRFSTFVCQVARSAMLTALDRREKRRGSSVPALHDASDTDEGGGAPGIHPTYSDTGHTPEGFGDPAVEIAREFANEAAETLLTELSASDSLLLREYLGLPTFEDDSEAMQVKEIASSRGIPRPTMSRDLIILQEILNAKQRERYMKTSPAESIYPPEGKVSWRTNLSANRNHAGFWHGMANAMGDTDVWRESTGTVWKDWSWKPTDQDIMNGAKP